MAKTFIFVFIKVNTNLFPVGCFVSEDGSWAERNCNAINGNWKYSLVYWLSHVLLRFGTCFRFPGSLLDFIIKANFC
jgi:hypothetical protein